MSGMRIACLSVDLWANQSFSEQHGIGSLGMRASTPKMAAQSYLCSIDDWAVLERISLYRVFTQHHPHWCGDRFVNFAGALCLTSRKLGLLRC